MGFHGPIQAGELKLFHVFLSKPDKNDKLLQQLQVHLSRLQESEALAFWHDGDASLTPTPPEKTLTIPERQITFLPFSNVLAWLEKLLYGNILYDAKDWRRFEEAVAELLQKDGYNVLIGPGQKDGGQDIIATKEDLILGSITSIWQAKMLAPRNKVDIAIIRELAGSCILSGAKVTKGIIVTTTYLTKDAFLQVERDRHFLGKKDRDDLLLWIGRFKKRRVL